MIPANALAAVTPEELSGAATLYGSLKQLRIRLTNAEEATLDRQFEAHVQNVLEKLENRLPSIENSRLKSMEICMARHGLFDASFQQCIVLGQSSTFPSCLLTFRHRSFCPCSYYVLLSVSF